MNRMNNYDLVYFNRVYENFIHYQHDSLQIQLLKRSDMSEYVYSYFCMRIRCTGKKIVFNNLFRFFSTNDKKKKKLFVKYFLKRSYHFIFAKYI